MDMLAQFGYLNGLTPEFCSLYGLIMLLVTVYTALNLERPKKQD
ncbi:MAG: hypothetical protein AB1424_14260 [Thermodesulfobacteriota bacterium]